jgi:hypothetical protein
MQVICLKKKIRTLIIILVSLVLLLYVGILTWSSNTYSPADEIWEYVSEEDYDVVGDFTIFTPKITANGIGIVIYPEALVEPLAYAYLANELAKEGYLVCILKMTFNMSIFEPNKAEDFIVEHEEIDAWYVAGHSMGGFSAASYAKEQADIVTGIIFLASYPPDSVDLSKTDFRILSIYAENDGLTLQEDIDSSMTLLPPATQYAKIMGGNHAGFGMYGEQKYDSTASISNFEQQNQIITLIIAFIENE